MGRSFLSSYLLESGGAAGIYAALLWTFSPLALSHARYAATDTPTAFFTACTLFLAALEVKNPRWGVVLGVSVGLTAAMKYSGGLIAFATIPALLCAPHRLRVPLILFLAAGAALGFVLGNFQLVFQFGRMTRGLSAEMTHYSHGHPGFETSAALLLSVRTIAIAGLGIVGATLAIVGLLVAANPRKLPQAYWIPVAAVAVYLLLLGTRKVFFARNVVHVLPAICVLAAVGLRVLTDLALRLRETKRRQLVQSMVIAIPLLALLPRWHSQIEWANALLLPDSRVQAGEWLGRRLRPGDRIAVLLPESSIYLPVGWDERFSHHVVPTADLSTLIKEGVRFVVYSDVARLRAEGSVNKRAIKPTPTEIRRLHDDLRRRASAPVTFGIDPGNWSHLLGSTERWYHHPKLEIFELPTPEMRREDSKVTTQ